MNKLEELNQYGQSYWLDNLTRDMLDSGELQQRVETEGLRGVTSNPKTFATSVQSGNAYHDDIRRLSQKGHSVESIYKQLMVDDIMRACDLLMPVYETSQEKDGFVSIEVDPRLARHAYATLEEARQLWCAVNRPNCMIKIPGTMEGLGAIEAALIEGINVNITLLFSLERYKRVRKCYERALRKRLDVGHSIAGMASVASLFLSRIDVLVDQLLMHQTKSGEKNDLCGMAGIAIARMVYLDFKHALEHPGWLTLLQGGAQLQRPLWASTGTKDPDCKKTKYVDSLIAEHSVSTMPEDTIGAFRETGTLEKDAILKQSGQAFDSLTELEEAGIDFNYITQRLEDEGIQKFIDPFMEGLEAVADVSDQFRLSSETIKY